MDEIIMVCHPDTIEYANNIAKQFGIDKQSDTSIVINSLVESDTVFIVTAKEFVDWCEEYNRGVWKR